MGKKPTKAKANQPAPAAKQTSRIFISIPSQAEFLQARISARKYRSDLMTIPQVKSVGVGARQRGGEDTGQWSVQILVASEDDKKELVADAKAGKNVLQPMYDGIPVDVIVLGEVAPACGGAMIESPSNKGSLGIDVFILPRERYWLTAAHVVEKDQTKPIGGQAIQFVGGSIVGTASTISLRNNLADFALVEPVMFSDKLTGFCSGSGAPADPKFIRGVTSQDLLHKAVWTVRGKTGKFASGTILSFDHPSVNMSTGETIDNPLILSAGLIEQGDSGGMIVSGADQEIIAIVRGVTENGLGVACSMEYVLDEVTLYRD